MCVTGMPAEHRDILNDKFNHQASAAAVSR